ncbi:DNA-binding HORMA, partial [Penicillium concentricum]
EQSLELMKITLHMTIASLLYTRGLLPRDTFGERVLRTSRFHERYSYSHFVKGKGNGNFARNRAEYVPICVVERHMSDEADGLLDLIENAIFDALLRGVLHAVQLTVITDKSSPNNVLESYTFTFDNCDERSLGIHVFYKPECPGSYDILGLTGSLDGTIECPRTSYWKRMGRFYRSVDSGFHTVGLRVNPLLSTSPGGEAHFPLVEEANFDAVLRSGEVGIPTPAQMPLEIVEEIYVSKDGSTSSDTDDVRITEKELEKLSYTPARHQGIATRKESRETRRYMEVHVDDRIFFSQEDVDADQSRVYAVGQSLAYSIAVNPDDISETQRKSKFPERPRRSPIPLNEPQEEHYAVCPIGCDGVHLSQDHREIRRNFGPAAYIRRLQDAGSKPTVIARTVDYVQNRCDAIRKRDEENKDNQQNLQKGRRRYRCECNTWRFKPSKSVSHGNGLSSVRSVLINIEDTMCQLQGLPAHPVLWLLFGKGQTNPIYTLLLQLLDRI